ncbi:MAG: tetratricopeptide repeat protein [Candidatus Omnitrophota bacterium]
MDTKKIKVIFILLIIVYLFVPNCYCGEDKELYYRGVNLARRGKADEAYGYFHMVLNNFDKSDRFVENALFGIGEYYFSIGARYEARETFRKVVDEYSESISALLALGYLSKIAKAEGKQESIESIKKEIISFKQVSLLFRDSEEFDFLSAMRKDYKAVYFIDKVEIYIDGEIFEEIPF